MPWKVFFILEFKFKNDMMIHLIDKPSTAPIGRDSETFTFKTLLYLNVAVRAQACQLFCFDYPAITNIFVVNQIFRYNGRPL